MLGPAFVFKDTSLVHTLHCLLFWAFPSQECIVGLLRWQDTWSRPVLADGPWNAAVM